MKHFSKSILFAIACMLISLSVHAQMSDEQVVKYVKEAYASGKGEQEIGSELLSRGVTRAQMERIKQRYEASKGSTEQMVTGDANMERRTRSSLPSSFDDPNAGFMNGFSVLLEDSVAPKDTVPPTMTIFGHNVFSNRALTFEPNENMATPANYRLGPGDEVIIDVWGANETTIRQEITPEGNIMVSQIGPIYLSGMTIEDASRKIRQVLSSKYAGISGDESQISVTLGQIRSIQVNVMGEVAVPGTYRLSSFSTVFHALYRAGGISEIGSLRNISLIRGGKKIDEIDVYNYILQGKTSDDTRLQEGDVIIVPPYDMLVDIRGNVKRPMFYEMKKDETLAALLNYAGGFAGDAYSKEVRLIRRTGSEKQIYSITEKQYASWHLADGDSVTVGAILNRYANRVEIRGAVYRPGMYELGGGLTTVKELIKRAEGLTGDAFTGRAILTREREDLTHEVLAVDLAGLLNGTTPDIPLRREDVLVIPSIHELQAQGAFTISGEVTRPGVYPYADNTTLEDLIVQAGGLLDGASTVRVDVSRRLKNPKSLEATTQLSETFTFALKDGFVIDGTPGFILYPYDMVEVRRSPGYQEQHRVKIGGEVVFAGGYTLQQKNERLSDLVKRAGGLTPSAYVRGGRLIRQMNEEEIAQRDAAIAMARMSAGSDSVSLAKLNVSDTYVVGIELDKALAHPGSNYDIVLREGDRLYIPGQISTVKISGEVQFPNTVAYIAGKGVSHYIDQAGGYSRLAKKTRAYIVYMNGTVSRVKRLRNAKIEPGCQIIVPSKKERRPISLAEVLSIGTSAASLGTMAATLYNIFK